MSSFFKRVPKTSTGGGGGGDNNNDNNNTPNPEGTNTTDPLSSPPTSTATEKRPGTSGTEMHLANDRRRASAQYRSAARRERLYRTEKRSAAARADGAEALRHLREGLAHHAAALRAGWGALRGVGYVVRDGNERRKGAAAERGRARAAVRRAKLEERLRRGLEAREDEKRMGEGEREGSEVGEEGVGDGERGSGEGGWRAKAKAKAKAKGKGKGKGNGKDRARREAEEGEDDDENDSGVE